MNRKGQEVLGWNLRTVAELVFAILILVAIGYMSYKLIALFVGGEHDYRAQRNFDLLTSRIQYAADNNVQSSVILQEPTNYVILGFDAGQDEIGFAPDSWPNLKDRIGDAKIAHPSACSKDQVCICAASLDVKFDTSQVHIKNPAQLITKFIDCKNVPAQTVAGTISNTEVVMPGIQLNVNVHLLPRNGRYQLFLATKQPANEYVMFSGNALLVSDSPFQPGGGKFGGSGATGSY